VITDAQLQAARQRGESPADLANRIGGMGKYRNADPMGRFIARNALYSPATTPPAPTMRPARGVLALLAEREL
jgi:hypothetical protein